MYRVIISSLIYLCAFFYPDYLYLCIFIWIIPLIFLRREYRFKDGYIWGLITFGIHMYWFGHIIIVKGQGSGRLFVYCITILYFSCISGFWFWFQNIIEYGYLRQFKNLKENMAALCCTWVISTTTFLYLTCYCSLALFGCFEGYPFINPLLPLVSCSWFISPISFLGFMIYWIIMVVINFLTASLIEQFNCKKLMGVGFLFLFPCVFLSEKHVSVSTAGVYYLEPTWNNKDLSQNQRFYQIGKQLDSIALNNSDVKFVCLPESSFGYDLISWGSKLGVWASLFDDGVSIFVGAHRHKGRKIYNCLYHIVDGEIVGCYDKSHLVPFVERIPFLAQCLPGFNSLFTTKDSVFSYPLEVFLEQEFLGFQTFICSEMFCEGKRPVPDKPVLFICNDSWFGLEYAQELAQRFVQLYSYRYKLDIVYVGSKEMKVFKY